ncbi:hypothetical protein PSP6_150088 [Paraburkholderia tropica]|nr:hypothetical protein PSP6_150088 [Paraburkholderia tropica]
MGAFAGASGRLRGRIEQIDVGHGHEVALVHAKLFEHGVRFGFAALLVVVGGEHHFQLDEIAETVHAVQMNARAAREIHVALLRDDAARGQRRRQQRVHGFGVRDGAARVIRGLGAVAVVALVEDQLGRRAVVELAQLQAAARHVVEEVLLAKDQRRIGGELGGALAQCVELTGAGFDFDVAGHASSCGTREQWARLGARRVACKNAERMSNLAKLA